MNFYNPYYFTSPTNLGYGSGLSSIFSRNFNFSSILNGAQKALGLFNQALPLIKEVTPMMKNARTMFRVMNEFKKMDNPSLGGELNQPNKNVENKSLKYDNKTLNTNGPTFFA